MKRKLISILLASVILATTLPIYDFTPSAVLKKLSNEMALLAR